jgi:hypothetical protein
MIGIHLFRLFWRALAFHNCVFGRFPASFKAQLFSVPLLAFQISVPYRLPGGFATDGKTVSSGTQRTDQSRFRECRFRVHWGRPRSAAERQIN